MTGVTYHVDQRINLQLSFSLFTLDNQPFCSDTRGGHLERGNGLTCRASMESAVLGRPCCLASSLARTLSQ